jgi:hypothetical protein
VKAILPARGGVTGRKKSASIRLAHNQHNWEFGLCFLYLRNVKDYGWDHKLVRRICRKLELNLRIKSRKWIVREKPEPLAISSDNGSSTLAAR